MKTKFFGSLVTASLLVSGAQAVSFDVFGHIGTAYSFGIDKVDDGNGKSEKPWYGGVTARAGFEVGFGPVSMGFGVAGGLPYLISPDGWFKDYIERGYFTKPGDVKWYNWLSDAYLRVDTRNFSAIGGRYDLSVFFDGKNGETPNGVDWVSGLSEGASFKLETRYLTWWGIYAYEMMDFGAKNPGRIGNDLMGFHQYSRLGNGDAHYFSTGFDINIKEYVYIDPFFAYLMQDGEDILQAGGKVELIFGDRKFSSQTTFRAMYQNYFDSTFLLWGDQEFKVYDVFKFGGGFYTVGNNEGIYHTSDKTRFYGNTFGTGIDYFSAGSDVWYVFTGITHKFFDLDVLYADGDYHEISVVGSVNIVNNRQMKFSVGGGWVKENYFDKVVAFTKLSF